MIMKVSTFTGLLCRSLLPVISVLLILWPAAGESEESQGFSKAFCTFGINLLKAQSRVKEGNVVLSPSSVGILLSILQQGARENTSLQFHDVLNMSAEESRNGNVAVLKSLQREKNNVTLEWGNRGYIRPGFEIDDNFNRTIQESFGAAIEEINFVEPSPKDAANAINTWVQQVTHDNIKELIPPSILTSDTVFILLNAVYFKGLWDVPFKKTLTKLDNFELTHDNGVEVEFMSQKERFIAGEDAESGVQWVDLPFKDDQFSMLFFLPSERHGLDKVLEKMSGTFLKNVIDDDQTRQVTLHIPKFKLTEKVLLSKALQELGLKDIFTSDANLQGITPNFKNLRVTKMIHEASVEIDEDGSTASAATGITIEVLNFPKASDHLTFKADHPFLFFILDRANRIPLFAGKVLDPSCSDLLDLVSWISSVLTMTAAVKVVETSTNLCSSMTRCYNQPYNILPAINYIPIVWTFDQCDDIGIQNSFHFVMPKSMRQWNLLFYCWVIHLDKGQGIV